jgi:WD40 repeat protein
MFWDDRLYLAIPTGTSTIPNTMFVLDFAKQRVQYYTYPFSVTSMFWDFDDNKLVAGTPDGALMLLERAAQDENTSGTATAIPWRVTTRRWSWPDEVRLTNLGLDSLGTVTAVMVKNPTGTVTASQTSTMAVRTNTIRDRYMPTSTGALANYVEFRFNGSDSNNSSLEGVF